MTLLREGRPGRNSGRLFSFSAQRPAVVVCLALCLSPLVGCGGGYGGNSNNGGGSSGGGGGAGGGTTGSGVPFQGTVSHGTQAISGASVQLYAAGSGGNGSAATALLSSAATTDASGKFNIPTNYSCPSASSQVYLVATGGNPGLTSGTNNSALALMTAIGACGNLSSGQSVQINEATTAGSVWALASFMGAGAGTNLGASSTNAQGLANAFTKVGTLVNTATGAAPGPNLPSGATAPTAELNTVASILSTCAGSSGTGGECSNLFAAATPAGGTAPSNTLDAALLIAQNPGNNVAALFAFLPASPPFVPVLTAAPGDWMFSLSYTGGGLNEPTALAVDGQGNVWVANYPGAVTELSPQGNALSPAGGFTGGGLDQSFGLTIDNSGNVWVTDEISTGVNHNQGSVTELNSSGQILSGASGYFSGGIDFPVAAAADPGGNIWIANFGGASATLLANSGVALSGTGGYASGQLSFPAAVAIDGGGNAWFANSSSSTVTRISPDGTQVSSFTCCNSPSGVAIDQQGNVWVTNYYGDSISELTSAGTLISSGYAGGGLNRPLGVAVDGLGNVWVANHLGNSITELQGAAGAAPGAAISPAGGYGSAAGLSLPFGIGIDSSGSIWVSSFNSAAVVEFVGAAAPVKTPLLGPVQGP